MGNIPQIDVKLYPDDSLQKSLAEYLNAWINCQWGEMFSKTQLTWQSSNDVTKLKHLTSGINLLGAIIGGENQTPGLKASVVRDIMVTIFYKIPFHKKGTKGNVLNKNILVRLVKESAPYSASETGKWGVNPISALREHNGDRRL